MSSHAVADRLVDHPALPFDLGLPLILDLDGTLFTTDTLHEALFLHLKRDWRNAWKVPLWTFDGRAIVKKNLAEAVTDEDVNLFPANAALRNYAEREASRGRKVVLATAADRSLAERAKKRFSFVSEVIASDGRTNLRGGAKAQRLQELFPQGFIYAGDSSADIHVWRRSAGAIFAGRPTQLLENVRRATNIAATFPPDPLGMQGLRRSLRLHQWVKNALIFVPLILGGKALDLTAAWHSLVAFLAFSLLASATYLLNDLWDLHEDRQHWEKRNRPLASGAMPIATGVGMIGLLGLAALGLALMLGGGCVAALGLYLVLTLSYSFHLKRKPMVDVFMLASLFTLRLVIGAVVSDVAFSPWLFVFSMFIFFSLSLAKRHTEILRMVSQGREATFGRGYKTVDAPFILTMGVASGVTSVVVLVLYIMGKAFPVGFYRCPELLWATPICVFLWLSHIWLLCNRGELHDDPVAFALKDRLSLFYAATIGATFAVAVL